MNEPSETKTSPLNSHPVSGSPVSVTLSNGSTISIPVGASSGTVTVTATDDVYTGGGSASATITAR